MIKIPLLLAEWNICSPTLFRFMDSQYVNAFFADGSLRISSFFKFHKHTDEQRLDKGEGKTMFVHRTNQRGGQTLTAWAIQGANAYVLSTSMRYDQDLLRSFNSDSYIRIKDSTAFGMAIARHIPHLVAGYEGTCLYQEMKIAEKDLGYIDLNQFQDPQNPLPVTDPKQIPYSGIPLPSNNRPLTEYILSQLGHYSMFLKDKKYAHQVEYRFIWVTSNNTEDYLDIKVPEAIQFCDKPNSLTE
jgi:hypothetical protein